MGEAVHCLVKSQNLRRHYRRRRRRHQKIAPLELIEPLFGDVFAVWVFWARILHTFNYLEVERDLNAKAAYCVVQKS